MLYSHIAQHYEQLSQQLHTIQGHLKTSPAGHLICCHNGNYQKWYHRNGMTRTIIPKSKRPLAEALALKKYYTVLAEDLQQELTAIDAYLQRHSSANHSDQLLQLPGYADLLQSYFAPVSNELTLWMNEIFEQNPKHPEHLIHKTLSGHLVRSKSEAMIDSFLFTHRIPFRYECQLRLGEISLYPDFTIRHPKNGQFFYWEHFGMMDDPSYGKQSIAKLQCYTSHGLIPSIHLITTYETQQHPLTHETIQKIVEHYFL